MKRILSLVAILALMLSYSATAQDIEELQSMVKKGNTTAMVKLAQYYEAGRGVAIDSAEAIELYQRAMNDPSQPNADAMAFLAYYYINSSFFTPDSVKAFNLCRKASEQGSPEAYTMLGFCYYNGIGVIKDKKSALHWFEKAAANGSARGLYHLGWNYYWGELGVKRDTVNALKCLRKAVALEEPQACDLLALHYASMGRESTFKSYHQKGLSINSYWSHITEAVCYAEGFTVPKDEKKALQLAEQARVTFGNRIDLVHFLITLYGTSSDPEVYDKSKALYLVDINLKQHSARTATLLAQSYQYGYFTPVDLNKAYQTYYQVANEMDYVEGQYTLAMLYLNNHVPLYVRPATEKQRLDSVMHYLNKAYEHSHIGAAEQLGHLYYNGYADEDKHFILRPNPEKSIEYYRNAATWGNTDMLFNLGQAYIKKGDRATAEKLYKEAIKKGNTNGYHFMAWSSLNVGNNKEAIAWLNKGANRKNDQCNYHLGILYERGFYSDIAIDYAKAAKHYEASNMDEARYRLAMLYINGKVGKGTAEEQNKAIQTLTIAARHGYRDALAQLGKCYERAIFVDQNLDSVATYYKMLASKDDPTGYFKIGQCYEFGYGVPLTPEECIRNYQAAADLSNGLAMCALGRLYRIGKFVQMDQRMAFEYYSTAAQQKENAKYGYACIGRSYLEGCGVECDTAMAIKHLHQACSQNVSQSYRRMGDVYFNGYGGMAKGYNDSSIYYYNHGATLGSEYCHLKMGVYHFYQGNYAEARPHLLVAAKAGEAEAIYLLGLCEQKGLATEVDEADAYKLFAMASKRTYNEELLGKIYYELGNAKLNGIGSEQNNALAKLYFDSSAHYGNIQGIYNQGICYHNGYGCEQNEFTALEHLERVADSNMPEALNLLGEIYFLGEGVPQDFNKAVKYYRRAVDAGSVEALCNYGYCYELGEGVVLNSQKAFEYYSLSASKGYACGMASVGYCYLHGIYVKKDGQEAAQWFEKAAEAGHEISMYRMGLAYLGELAPDCTIKPNKTKAKAWLKQAADKGYQPAVEKLEKLK